MLFFCQNTHDDKGRSILNQVETMETGVKISNAVKRFRAYLENLENLEKGPFLRNVRENLEKSGNFFENCVMSGKSQGKTFFSYFEI